MIEVNNLRDFYKNISSLTPGESFEYRNYSLKKAGNGETNPSSITPVEHTEVGIYNPDGRKVESFTLGAFDSFEEFRSRLDEVIDYNPESMSDWLNRES